MCSRQVAPLIRKGVSTLLRPFWLSAGVGEQTDSCHSLTRVPENSSLNMSQIVVLSCPQTFNGFPFLQKKSHFLHDGQGLLLPSPKLSSLPRSISRKTSPLFNSPHFPCFPNSSPHTRKTLMYLSRPSPKGIMGY